MSDPWTALKAPARAALSQRNYAAGTLLERLGTTGATSAELLSAERAALLAGWIPGVEFVPRRVFRQRHRGFFGEFVREGHGVTGSLGLWPRQWASATMFAGTAKGFHIHPPHIPENTDPAAWFEHLFGPNPAPVSERPYEKEQWDVMFFVRGNVEMLLVDERMGLPRRVMRFVLEGDDSNGNGHAGVVIPAGVAHALRVEGSTDAIMVYGTSTVFDPAAEGRIADDVERAPLPSEWQAYLEGAQ
ncbi:MAG: 5-epimerase [Verrucomicrobia bacterium]|nr:MAG: 5-epimerase [Verrucomicrobiota bacterium]